MNLNLKLKLTFDLFIYFFILFSQVFCFIILFNTDKLKKQSMLFLFLSYVKVM